MVSRVQRYFLEIKDFSKLIDLNLPENHKIILDDKKDFQLNIIPHTLRLTNLKHLKINDLVNVELDIFGKYIYKYTI